ncbi:hypothetical protein BSL78_17808 [Apostichopus japonicus]|uniref:CCHC-type domain-containing protein n=1 Tax=Stichopus japonicus TaxID=307972 RepID=A0A2G8KBJ0_STIJA|nr:hypothetical protein BSL78_17808 [Apostichopus japonicus]
MSIAESGMGTNCRIPIVKYAIQFQDGTQYPVIDKILLNISYIHFVEDGDNNKCPRILQRENFAWTRNEVSEQFRYCVNSSAFIAKAAEVLRLGDAANESSLKLDRSEFLHPEYSSSEEDSEGNTIEKKSFWDETQQKKRVNEGHDQPSTSRKRLRTTEQRTDRELPLLYNTDREVQDEGKSATEEAKEEIRNAYLGESALEVYNSFKFEKESDKFDLEVLKQKFQDYCSPRQNITYERHQFFSRQQQENESIDHYVTDLRNKSATCEFGDLNDSLIRDRIVCGIRSDSLRERMLREPDIKLDTAINMCRAAEVSKTQVKNLGITEKEKMCYPAALNYQNKGNKNHANSTVTYTRPTRDSDKPKQFKCKRCATTHGPRECPAYGKNCSNCNKFGHFAKCCRFERRVNVIEDSYTSESETELFLDTVCTINDITTGNEWLVDMAVGKRKVQFKMDTGAQANILPFSYKKAANGKALHKTRVKLSTYSGETLPVLGKCMLMCKHNGQNNNAEFLVVNMKSQPILALQSCEKFGLIQNTRG